jgi:hypothetical protein
MHDQLPSYIPIYIRLYTDMCPYLDICLYKDICPYMTYARGLGGVPAPIHQAAKGPHILLPFGRGRPAYLGSAYPRLHSAYRRLHSAYPRLHHSGISVVLRRVWRCSLRGLLFGLLPAHGVRFLAHRRRGHRGAGAFVGVADAGEGCVVLRVGIPTGVGGRVRIGRFTADRGLGGRKNLERPGRDSGWTTRAQQGELGGGA